ncbi:hypothetical protein [Rhodoplanes sp. SY1]|uniref:hypothetical protein n=1 Tax=Rhodoplanes sp. SY1 TaxID=3166646 RepID=UPI0038B67EBF
MIRTPGLWWARIDHDGTGPAEEPTVVELDGDGDIWAIADPDPLDPARVTWIEPVSPPRGTAPAATLSQR